MYHAVQGISGHECNILGRRGLDQFESSRPGGENDESQYYGAYNCLLNILFPWQESYTVMPQYRLAGQVKKSIDLATVFLIQLQQYPIFSVEIKPVGDIHHISRRESAGER